MRSLIKQYTFKPSLIGTLLCLVAACLLISLGLWQQQRGTEKAQRELKFQRQHRTGPRDLTQTKLIEPFQPLKVTGHYAPYTFLLANQFHEHHLGYHVITPFIPDNDTKLILVNRGFTLKPSLHNLPKIKTPTKQVTLTGRAYFKQKNPFIKAEALKRVPLQATVSIDHKMIAELLEQPLYPFMLYQDKGGVGAYLCDWHYAPRVSKERHYAYALQWYLLAALVIVFYTLYYLNPRGGHGRTQNS